MFNTNKVRSAIKAGDTKVLEEMLPEGLDPNATLKKDKDWTLLHFAAKSGHTSIVAFLLEHGACVNTQTGMRQTALDVASNGKQTRIADPDIQNAYRLSPVELAKRRDQTHLVNLMEKQIDRSLIGESVSIEQLLTIGKVAELLSVEEAFVTKLLVDGKLRHVKLDANMMRIPASSLRKYISKLLK